MKKKKTCGAKAVTAGPHISAKTAQELIAELEAAEERRPLGDFGKGAAAAVAFLSCPAGRGMHGAGFGDFVANAKVIADRASELPEEAFGAAMDVIEKLEAMGVSVVSAAIVREVPRG